MAQSPAEFHAPIPAAPASAQFDTIACMDRAGDGAEREAVRGVPPTIKPAAKSRPTLTSCKFQLRVEIGPFALKGCGYGRPRRSQ